MKVFTLEDGLRVQTEGLAGWATVLKPECFAKLEQHAHDRNQLLGKDATGWDVWRGQYLYEFVANQLIAGHALPEGWDK